MEAGNGRVNLGGGSTTTNGNARPTTWRNPGRSADANQNANANVSARTPPVDMGMMYQFFFNLMQAGAAAVAVGSNAVNAGGANPVAQIGNSYAKLSRDYTSLGGRKRKFFKKKDAQKGVAAKKRKADIVCYKCNKKGHYANECRSGDGKEVVGKQNVKCYNCNKIGHYKNKCPEAVKEDKGKVFALEPSSFKPTAAEKGKSVMKGTLLIHSIPVRALFDTGASHSFISQCLVDRLCLEPSYLVTSLRVANPIGGYATLERKM